jgi:hypothetical protein
MEATANDRLLHIMTSPFQVENTAIGLTSQFGIEVQLLFIRNSFVEPSG